MFDNNKTNKNRAIKLSIGGVIIVEKKNTKKIMICLDFPKIFTKNNRFNIKKTDFFIFIG